MRHGFPSLNWLMIWLALAYFSACRRRQAAWSGCLKLLLTGAQAVHELYDVTEGGAWGSADTRSTRIVVIGCRLQRSELEHGLRQCTA